MTEVITRSRLAANANSIMVNNIKSGINWGTNSFPANSLPAWFAGPNSGPAIEATKDTFKAGEASPTDTVTAMRNLALAFAGVRTTRIIIYRTHWSAGTVVLTDITGIANSAYPVTDFTGSVDTTALSANRDMDLNVFDTLCQDLLNVYWMATRWTTQTLTNTVCHTSCHSSCHSSRGRR